MIPPSAVWYLDHYTLTGPAHVHFGVRRVSYFVVRYAGRGGGWLRFVAKLGYQGQWWVTHHNTKRSAAA